MTLKFIAIMRGGEVRKVKLLEKQRDGTCGRPGGRRQEDVLALLALKRTISAYTRGISVDAEALSYGRLTKKKKTRDAAKKAPVGGKKVESKIVEQVDDASDWE
jgi:hypothetical protein